MDAYCQDCRFFAPAEGQMQGSGQCRRYPPTIPSSPKVEAVDVGLRAGVWPMVAGESWCGEFQIRTPVKKA